jgi:hypothetical protein
MRIISNRRVKFSVLLSLYELNFFHTQKSEINTFNNLFSVDQPHQHVL